MLSKIFIQNILYTADKLDGVIKYLYRTHPNTYLINLIHSHPSSTDPQWCSEAPIDPSNTGPSMQNNWASKNLPNSYYSIYFPKHLIELTHYTLQTQTNHSLDTPKSWRLDGSIDGINWENIDIKSNVQETKNTQGYSYIVNVNKVVPKYSHFKFTQTDVNHSGINFFDIGKIEFFGKLFLSKCFTTKQLITINYFILINIFIIL